MAEKSLHRYVQQAWRVIEPDPFVDNWHIEAICYHLEAITFGRLRGLVINIPPRFTKSLLVSVLWPSWEWGPANRPKTRWLFNSYSAGLSLRDAVKCRTLIQSPWYQQRWGKRFQLTGDQNAKERYNTTANGYRVSSSVGGLGTGEGADRVVVDDPHNIVQQESDAARESVLQWWSEVMPTRVTDYKTSSKVLIMQRSHYEDLAGYIWNTNREDYEWLVLPNEFEEGTCCQTSINNWKDPRKREGELLCEARLGLKETESQKKALGSYAYAGQFQQRPSPREGGIFKRHWWQYYRQIPDDLDYEIASWDMTFKNVKNSDRVAGHVYGVKGANVYLLDRMNARMSFTETCQAMRVLSGRWPAANHKLVEDKANGPAVIDQMKREVPGLLARNPEGSKGSRAWSCTADVEAGNLFLPHPSLCPWVEEFIEELAAFPSSPYDDDVDAFTQALIEIRKRRARTPVNATIVSMTRRNPWGSASGVRL